MTEFKELTRKIVDKLFLVVWSPWGEKNESDIDISFGFVFNNRPNELCVISVDKDELWSPHMSFESLPADKYSWEDFHHRIKKWMNAEDECLIIGKEYYDVSDCDLFNKIVGSEIEKLEWLYLEDNTAPFGLKILFKDDYIISVPNVDGNTVETKYFNKNNAIENFKRLGNIIHLKV
jgi:hypothetical protein